MPVPPTPPRRRLLLAAGGSLALGACAAWQRAPIVVHDLPAAASAAPAAPAAPEFRGAWVATVANIDWPSRPGLPAAQQQAEARALLDSAQALNLNALLLQVRTAADALYPSALEPWSEVLTGTQGQSPGYDPLALWIEEAARRGIELHAWINPYRARHAQARSPLASTHVARVAPELVRRYGDQLWMDPAEPAAQQRTLAVAADLLQRYPLAGLHIDDYFYPYPVKAADGAELDFPDEPAWQRQRAASPGATPSRADWRREQVNTLVQALHATVRQLRPQARFGISPFGLGRPERRPPGISGFSQYDRLYADAELWLQQGWCDYFSPQLYWPLDARAQAFGVLADYWRAQSSAGVPVWPGLYTSRVGEGEGERGWPAEEIVRQVALLRERGFDGHLHFSLRALHDNRRGLATLLRAGPYREAAPLPPPPKRVLAAAR